MGAPFHNIIIILILIDKFRMYEKGTFSDIYVNIIDERTMMGFIVYLWISENTKSILFNIIIYVENVVFAKCRKFLW